jgi:uncharacterized protein YeaO (DUF488 family)
MPVRTKRWNDPADADDGFRLLVCRIRPRGVPKAGEPWDEWWPDLGPSRGLLDDFHGKRGAAITWDAYVPRYLEEMRGAAQLWRIRDLARRVGEGDTVTLLCSSACTDSTHCHRTLLARLVTTAAAAARPSAR